MTSGDFQHLRRTFDQLLTVDEDERKLALERMSESDAATAAELESMLRAYGKLSSFLDRPAAADLKLESDAMEPTPSRVGIKIGPYVLESELGRGGMGVVYRAVRADGTFEKRVAIKILRNDRTIDLFLYRFQRERQILAQLDHPHIASILDAGATADGEPYFVMEYVDGVPITAYCRSNDLAIHQKLDLFLQICDAVQYAHRNLTVHRDLKPGNILVTEGGAIKLLDFGIAKLLDSDSLRRDDTAITAAILTPEYTSPEQIRRETVTTSTDIFQLGILLYEMLTGQHPFRGKDRLPHEVMRAICEDDPPAPGTIAQRDARQIRGELDAIVLTSLRKQPEWRYPSVEQMAEDITRYRQGWPVVARGNSLSYRLRKFVRRQWLPLAAAVALVLLLLAGIFSTLRQARIAEDARQAAELSRAQAEQALATAERERIAAETARRVATEQQALAETRTREVEFERQKERQRYREVRSLASSLLFDLHDGIRDLAGSTTARRLIVSKAQQQLELLNADSGNDISVQRDLAAAYERLGELRVDPRHPDKNDAAAALDYLRRAIRIRERIFNGMHALPSDRRDMALSLSKLGDGQFWAADVKDALVSYQSAWNLAQAEWRTSPGDAERRTVAQIDERRCFGLLASGNTAGAMDACREGIASLSDLHRRRPNDVEIQRLTASIEASYANALRLAHKPQEAVVQARQGLESLQRLQTLAPNNAEYRRMASSTETILASSLAAAGDSQRSTEAFRRAVKSMQVAVEIDPSDLGSALRLAVTLREFSRRLKAGNDDAGAHDAAQEALQLLQQTNEKPGAGPMEWNEYADALLKVDWPDLQQPAKALALAQKAAASTDRKNPFILDTLAWAYFRNGDAPKAIEAEQDALRLLPPNAQGGLHEELDRGLKTFQDARK
ncbi:MAG TPA: protein kinase [Bryobacteraceae bacterium]|jgi:tetratricopeptide (TPR) repeat protein/tRNA A-37 threonylcarbamoyl transferase component Bud32